MLNEERPRKQPVLNLPPRRLWCVGSLVIAAVLIAAVSGVRVWGQFPGLEFEGLAESGGQNQHGSARPISPRLPSLIAPGGWQVAQDSSQT